MKKNTKKGLVIGCVIVAVVIAVIAAGMILGWFEGEPNPPATTVPTTQGTQPTQTNPTTNPTNPTEPTTQPTEPTTQPTDPTDPTEPTTQPTDPTEPHVHEYVEEVTDPTCTEEGYTTYSCECGDTYIGNSVPALGHTYTEEVIEATCISGGYTAYTCHCGDTYIENKVPATGHTYTEKVTEATCTEAGYTTFTCSCGDTYKGSEVPALGHAWSEWETVQEPTEEAEGKRQRTCSRCEAVEEGTIAKLPASHKHSYTTVVTEPTCTSGGYTTYTCECGDTYQADEVSALGHSFTEYKSNNDATCMLDGTETAECDRGCGEKHTVPDEGSALGCDYEAVETKPTCTSGGYTTYTCTRCGEGYVSDKVAALGHEFTQYVSDENATCTADGTKTAKCERCDKTDTLPDEGSMRDHMYEIIPTDPTCTEDGYTTYTCIDCGETYVSDEVAAIGHNWSEWEVTLEPTEEAEGKKERTCANCSETETQTIPQLEHVHDYTAEVTEPTCESEGYTTYTCKCGDSYLGDKVSALDHHYSEWKEDPAPTCEDGGQKVRSCTRCGVSQSQKIEALGHDFQTVVTPPTCTEDGCTTSTCQRCGEVVISDETAATGHKWGDWEVTQDPTEDTEGEEQRKCAACAEVEKRPVDKRPHSHAYVFTYVSPTCTEKGYTEYVCKCGDSYREDYEDALGHAYVKTVVDPTCTEKGYTIHTCSSCGESYTDSETAAKGHKWTTWVEVQHPTCLMIGIEERTCPGCDSVESRNLDALGGMKDVTYANITYEGTMNVRSGPSTSYSKVGTIAGGSRVVVERTTEINGQTWAAIVYLDYPSAWIRIDGYAEIEEVKEPVGHIWGDWKDTQPATCLAAGKQERTCTNCTETQKRNTDKAGHTWGAWETKEGSNCTGGIRKERTCSVCGEKEVEVTAAAHAYTHWTVHAEATCTKAGSRSRSCVNCGEVEEETLEALGHDWNNWEYIKKPTSTEAGEQMRTCYTCGKTELDIIPAGHTRCDCEKTVVNPTCTKDGYTIFDCKVCGYIGKSSIVKASGHSWSDWETTLEPQIGKVGYEQRTCTTCGETMAVAIPPLDENDNAYVQYVDPKLTTDTHPDAYMYYIRDGGTNVTCVDFRTWGAGPSVWINDDGTMTVVYYNMAGERIEVHVALPQDGYVRRLAIREDGTYEIAQIGGYG